MNKMKPQIKTIGIAVIALLMALTSGLLVAGGVNADGDDTHDLTITSVSYDDGWIYYSLDTGCAYVMVIIEDTEGNIVYLGPSPDPEGQPYSGRFYHELGPGEYVLYVQGPDCGAKARATFTVSDGTEPTVPVTGVSMSVASTTIYVGNTYTLRATVTPSNATDRSVTWSSDDPSVATVSNGVVTGVSPGTAVITATTVDGGYTATCTVTVQSSSSAGSIRFVDRFVTVVEGYTVSVPIDVGDYTRDDIRYEISNPEVAEVRGLSIGNGVSADEFIVEGLQAGTATLRMWVDGDESISAQCTITVEEEVGDPCDLYYFFIKFQEGDTSGSNMEEAEARAGFWAYGEGDTAADALRDAANRYGWQLSFDETYYAGWLDRFMELPTVTNDDGTYTYWAQYHWNGSAWEYNSYALGYLSTTAYQYIAMVYSTTSLDHAGTIDLGVTPDDIPDDILQESGGGTVTPDTPGGTTVSVTGVTLDAEHLDLRVGGSASLTATVSPSNATNRTVTWSSDDASIATVSNGVVTGISPGTATITVTTVDGGFIATCTVTVTAVQGIEVSVDADGGSAVLTDDQVQGILDAISQATGAPEVTVTVAGTGDSLDVTIPSGLSGMAEAGTVLIIASDAGTIVFDEGAVRSLAAGGDSLRLTISIVEDVAAPEGSTVFGISAYVGGVGVETFGGTATVSLPYGAGGDVRVWYVDGDGLTEADFEYSDGSVTVAIDGPSTIAIGVEEDAGTAPPDEEEGGSDDALLYAAIVVVIVIIAIAAVLMLRRRA